MSSSTQKWCAALVDLYVATDKKHSIWHSSICDIHPIPSQLVPFTGTKVGGDMYSFSSLLESVQNEHLQGNRHAQAPPHQRVIRMQNEGTSEDIRIGQLTGMISNSLRSGAAASR